MLFPHRLGNPQRPQEVSLLSWATVSGPGFGMNAETSVETSLDAADTSVRATSSYALLLPCLLFHCGCVRYADFKLPAPATDPAQIATFDWKPAAAPVLSRGAWDSQDVLNPSVLRRAGAYFNFYSGYDGKTWHTGLATSTDGVHWLKQGKILSPRADTWEGAYIAANGSALDDGAEFSYWYQAGPRQTPEIGLAQSADGREWRRLPAPVLATGPRGSWDERGAADPYVIRAGGLYNMYYLGQDRARRQRLGVARSTDGVHWWKLRSNPILELGPYGAFDEIGLGEPAVWQAGGKYWMLYTGRGRGEIRRLGLARSSDGVTWEKLPGAFAGTESWNSKVICDPSVLVENSSIRVWFGGGDVASPDENLHGQIGVASLVPRL
jgi:predicted GH43/DUF377 family glycosyl hydrolase